MKKDKLFMAFMLASAVALSACDQKKKDQPAAQESSQQETAPVDESSKDVAAPEVQVEEPAQGPQETPVTLPAESPTPPSSDTIATVPEKPEGPAIPEGSASTDTPPAESNAS